MNEGLGEVAGIADSTYANLDVMNEKVNTTVRVQWELFLGDISFSSYSIYATRLLSYSKSRI